MIDIFGTTIDESEIIGVGPFMVKVPADVTVRQLYNERAFYFEVYTKRYHFVITTDWLSGADQNQKDASTKVHAACLQAHKELKNALITGSFTALGIGK